MKDIKRGDITVSTPAQCGCEWIECINEDCQEDIGPNQPVYILGKWYENRIGACSNKCLQVFIKTNQGV